MPRWRLSDSDEGSCHDDEPMDEATSSSEGTSVSQFNCEVGGRIKTIKTDVSFIHQYFMMAGTHGRAAKLCGVWSGLFREGWMLARL